MTTVKSVECLISHEEPTQTGFKTYIKGQVYEKIEWDEALFKEIKPPNRTKTVLNNQEVNK